VDLILIKSESRFPIKRKRIKDLVSRVLKERGIFSKVELSLFFVGGRRMRSLNRDFRSLNRVASVLSFSQLEKKGRERFVAPPDEVLRLGDVVVCYPEAQRLAGEEEILVDEEIDRLVEHGLLHLLGIHH
jgi:probable rRNA maturation factor